MPLPNQAIYDQRKVAATTAYKNALARINQKRGQYLRQSGYLGDVNPETGALTNLRVDPNNQFGGFQSMLRGQADRYMQGQFAGQERGLRGGLANKVLSQLRHEAGRESSDFGQAMIGSIGGFQDEQSQAAAARDAEWSNIDLEAAREAIEQERHNQAPPVPEAAVPEYGEDPFEEGYQPYPVRPSPRVSRLVKKLATRRPKPKPRRR